MTESKSFNRVSTVILTLLVILAMLPIILIVIASFSAEDALIRDGYTYFPAEWSLDSYYYMVKQGIMILRAYGVSFFVTFFGTGLSVLLTTMLAYPMARKSFRGRNVLAFFVFFTMLFNGGIVPSYIMWTQIFGIKDTIWALIIPNYLVTAFNVILVKNYYQNSVPDSLISMQKASIPLGQSSRSTIRLVGMTVGLRVPSAPLSALAIRRAMLYSIVHRTASKMRLKSRQRSSTSKPVRRKSSHHKNAGSTQIYRALRPDRYGVAGRRRGGRRCHAISSTPASV